MLKCSRQSLILGLACLFAAGCGRRAGPELAPVEGTVTYQDQPLPDATVVFAPASGERIAQGMTDADGRYTLLTFRPGDGAIVGEHRVTIVARGPNRLPPPGTPGRGMPGGPMLPGEPLIPEKYVQAATSDLTAEVRSGKRNVVDFVLED